jgi:hypothetical protein
MGFTVSGIAPARLPEILANCVTIGTPVYFTHFDVPSHSPAAQKFRKIVVLA